MAVHSATPRPGANVCPECGGRLIHDCTQGSVVCTGCGYVVEEHGLDYGPEWRAYDGEQEEKRSRSGPPATLAIHDKGLATTMDWSDYHNRSLTSERRAQIYRLRKWQRRTRVSSAAERNLAFALAQIDRMASQLALPRGVKEEAALIYRKALEKNMTRGRSIDALAAAALYVACQESKIPRTLNEIAETSQVSVTEVDKSRKSILRQLSIRLSPVASFDFIPRIVSNLGLDGKIQAQATKLARRCERKGITQMCDPRSVAAAAVYIASVRCGKKVPQLAIADVMRLSEVTIRNALRKICDGLRIKMPNRPMEKPDQKWQKGRASLGVQNIVVSVTWGGAEFDLKKLSEKLAKNGAFWDVSYDPEKFPGMAVKLKEPLVSFLVFESGKATCTGGKSMKDVHEAAAVLTQALRKAGLPAPKPRLKVQNVVLSFNIGQAIDIRRIMRTFEEVEFNPEVFPGVTVRLKDPKAELLIFASGRGVCVGTRSVAAAKRAVEKFRALAR